VPLCYTINKERKQRKGVLKMFSNNWYKIAKRRDEDNLVFCEEVDSAINSLKRASNDISYFCDRGINEGALLKLETFILDLEQMKQEPYFKPVRK